MDRKGQRRGSSNFGENNSHGSGAANARHMGPVSAPEHTDAPLTKYEGNVASRGEFRNSISTEKKRERARSHPASFRARINSFGSDKDEDETRKGYERKRSEKRLSSIKTGNEVIAELTLQQSKSLENILEGAGDKWPKVTRHMLYKEAIYTCAHMLGKPSKRFPCDKEEITIYAHETFSTDAKEQKAVNEHVESEPFPFTIVNTKVRNAVGLQAKDINNLADPYCVVALETEKSLHQKQWQTINIGSPLKPKKFKNKKERLRPNAESRYDQIYENLLDHIKTAVQMQTLSPVWEQRFQCLALRPGADILTVEVWDHDGEANEKNVLKAIKSFKDPSAGDDVEEGLRKNQQNVNVSRTKPDDFLGKATIQVSEIPVEGLESWFLLEGKAHSKDQQPHGKIRLQIWLAHAYRHGRHYEEVVEPKLMLEKLWDWVLKAEKEKFGGDGDWDGTIPKEATCLLFQYALQNGISEDSQAMIRWNSYAKVPLTVTGLDNHLRKLDDVVRKSFSDEAEGREPFVQQKQQTEIEATMLKVVRDEICPIIRNHLSESEDKVREAVKSFKRCREIVSKFDSSTLDAMIWLFEAALRMSVLEWYQARFAEIVQVYQGMKNYNLVTCITKVVNAVNAVLKVGFDKWSPLFWMDGMTEYLPIVYDELQKMIIHDVEPLCWLILEYYDTAKMRKILQRNFDEDKELCKNLFDLYVQTQGFVQYQVEIFKNEKPLYENLNIYHRWFRPVLILWLGFALIKGSEMINKAIHVDTIVREDSYVKTSSSALDTAHIFYQLVEFWRVLHWPDVSESYVILNYLLEIVCYYTLLYADLKHKKIDAEGYFDTDDRFDISERLCTALNNIEYVKEYMVKIPTEYNMYYLLHDLREVCGVTKETDYYKKRLDDTISKTLFGVEIHFQAILTGISTRIRPEINLRIQEWFARLESISNNSQLDECLQPLLEYLEENICVLQQCLMEMNFLRMLKLIWNIICEEISKITLQTTIGDQNEQTVFFRRVLQLFPVLKSYFEGNGAGLSCNDIHSRQYIECWQLLSYMTMPTTTLIEMYYGQRGEQQLNQKSAPHYGILRVRLSYWQGKLCAEVISASGLKVGDVRSFWSCCKKSQPNSDPFVDLELLPETFFPGEEKHTTSIKYGTLNPTYDEKFCWSVSTVDCEKENSVLVLTVKDHDVVSRNEFLGEAIIPLRVIPGVSRTPLPQPMNVHLRTVHVHCNPILLTLKTRILDREAQTFYNNQTARIIQDQK